MVGKRKAPHRNSSVSSQSIVEKLKILRNLNCGYSESDLSNCLRQSGYRLDVAADRLVSGQYRSLKKSKNKFQVVQGGITTEATIETNNSDNANAISRQSTTQRQSLAQLASPPSTITTIPYSKFVSDSESLQTPSVPKIPILTSGVFLSSSSTLVTPKAMTPATKHSNNGTIKAEANNWLLCRRWVGDGLNLQRDGSCDYEEEFHVQTSPSTVRHLSSNTNKRLRFRSESHRMNGSFPRYLAFLGPLIRNQLIRVKATALMEERRLSIGSQVAFSLSVWIVDLIKFFSVFNDTNKDHSTDRNVSSYSKEYFAVARACAKKSGRRDRTSMDDGPKSGTPIKTCRDAAFSMLQWAQYGNSSLSHRPDTCLDDAIDDDNNTECVDEAIESNDNEKDDIDAETPTILNSTKDEDAKIPDWAQKVLSRDDKGGTVVGKVERKDDDTKDKEMETPSGFREGIQLRPYQKQSLYWMTQREQVSNGDRTSLLHLLRELAGKSLRSIEEHEVCALGSRTAISCDCGPVIVDTTLIDAPSVGRAFVINNSNNCKIANIEQELELDHPLWERRFVCNEEKMRALSFFVQPSFRNAAAEPPPPPLPCRGGILADSMGLGKTVQLLALVQADVNRENKKESNGHVLGKRSCINGSTLVVAPLSLLHQWQEEIENKTSLSYRVHYNHGKKDMIANCSYDFVDVVLTTYGTLQAEFRTQSVTGIGKNNCKKETAMDSLLSKNWKRVILDECHVIKNHSTMVAKACCLLRAERRWAVSGTIIQNSLEDVFSLMHFLRHEPFCDHSFWNNTITKAPDFSTALNRVKNLLSPIMIRRTKESRDHTGQLILALPYIDCKSVVVEFSPEERQFYEALYRKSFDIFKGLVRAGTASSSWLKIFSLLHRLRQTCSHVALTIKAHLHDGEWASNIIKSSSQNTDDNEARMKIVTQDGDSIDQSFLEDLLEKFHCMQKGRPKKGCSEIEHRSNKDENDEYALTVANMLNEAVKRDSSELNEECPICLERISMNHSAITPCLHIFCKDCLLGFLMNDTESGKMKQSLKFCIPQKRSCPVCSTEVDSQRVLQMTHTGSRKIQTSFLIQRSHDRSKKNPNMSDEDGNARKTLQTAMQGTSSSKLEAILKELQLLWEKEPGSKVLIFSQFLGFLDIIEKSFEINGIQYGRLDGKLSQKQRMKVLHDFRSETQKSTPSQNSITGSVLLISMRAGGVGLNLVAARGVFIVDPWWNAAVEDQCVDRIHRIGQAAKKIYVRKFFVANTIEERILELQKRKKGVARAVLDRNGTTGAEGIYACPSIDDFKILFNA